MSYRALYLRRGWINENAPLNNGVGRFIPQLMRMTIKFCKERPTSQGIRYYYTITVLQTKTNTCSGLGSNRVWIRVNFESAPKTLESPLLPHPQSNHPMMRKLWSYLNFMYFHFSAGNLLRLILFNLQKKIHTLHYTWSRDDIGLRLLWLNIVSIIPPGHTGSPRFTKPSNLQTFVFPP